MSFRVRTRPPTLSLEDMWKDEQMKEKVVELFGFVGFRSLKASL